MGEEEGGLPVARSLRGARVETKPIKDEKRIFDGFPPSYHKEPESIRE